MALVTRFAVALWLVALVAVSGCGGDDETGAADTASPADTASDNGTPDGLGDTSLPDAVTPDASAGDLSDVEEGGGTPDSVVPDGTVDDSELDGPFVASLTYLCNQNDEPPVDVVSGAVVVQTLYTQQTLVAFDQAEAFSGGGALTVTFAGDGGEFVLMTIGDAVAEPFPVNLVFGNPDDAGTLNTLVWYSAAGAHAYFTGPFAVDTYVDDGNSHALTVSAGSLSMAEF